MTPPNFAWKGNSCVYLCVAGAWRVDKIEAVHDIKFNVNHEKLIITKNNILNTPITESQP